VTAYVSRLVLASRAEHLAVSIRRQDREAGDSGRAFQSPLEVRTSFRNARNTPKNDLYPNEDLAMVGVTTLSDSSLMMAGVFVSVTIAALPKKDSRLPAPASADEEPN